MKQFVITSVAAVASTVVLIFAAADGAPTPEVALLPTLVVAQSN